MRTVNIHVDKVYIVKCGGKLVKVDIFREQTIKGGRKIFMGSTFRGTLVAIVNPRNVLEEVPQEEIFYSKFRALGVEQCLRCKSIHTANSKFFPEAYKHEKTVDVPICEKCLRTTKEPPREWINEIFGCN